MKAFCNRKIDNGVFYGMVRDNRVSPFLISDLGDYHSGMAHDLKLCHCSLADPDWDHGLHG